MSRPNQTPLSDLAARSMTRRAFGLKSLMTLAAIPAGGSLLAACGGGDDKAGAATGTVTWASFGGAYNEALQRGFVDPFSKKTGTKVRLASNTSLAGLKQQVAAKSVQWDLVELSGSEYQLALSQGIELEKLDFDIIKTDNVPDYAKGEYGIKYAFFMQVMAWDERAVKSPPETWADFLDPTKFPVKRSLYETLSDSSLLEFALIADGVAMTDLYPLDVPRALAALERLGADKILWYETNQEVIQQMQSGESGLGMPFTGRIRIANDGGAKIGYTLNQGGVTGDYLVIPKGAPNAKQAMELLNFICNDAEAGASFMKETFYGVSNLKAVELLPADIADSIPTSPALEGKIFMKDDAWWSENLDSVTQQLQAWQLKLK
jgi:putative spermidine/putrescine transport system substrate-binding protein